MAKDYVINLGLIFLVAMLTSYFVGLNLELVNFFPEFPRGKLYSYTVYIANYPKNATAIVRLVYHSNISIINGKWIMKIKTPANIEVTNLEYNSTHFIQCYNNCWIVKKDEIIYFNPYLLIQQCKTIENRGKIYNFVLNTSYGNFTCNPFIFCYDNSTILSACYDKKLIQYLIYKKKFDHRVFLVEMVESE